MASNSCSIALDFTLISFQLVEFYDAFGIVVLVLSHM